MHDRTTQVVLGVFAGTFCFTLFGALSLRSSDQSAEVPQLAVSFALLLSLAIFASLIVLIQHITTMLQAPKIVAAAGEELRSVVSARVDIEGLDARDDQENTRLSPETQNKTLGVPLS